MLIYHPVEDSNHCCYRILRFLYSVKVDSLPLATIMICDFYTLFPGQLKSIYNWPRKNSNCWHILQAVPDEYEEMLNPNRVFFQLNKIQQAAISHLKAKGIVSSLNDSQDLIRLNKDSIPPNIIELLNSDETSKEDWFSIISNDLCKIDLNGKNGLKSKTRLMEFIYD